MAKKVIIYTAPGCTYCKMAKDFFKKNKVAFTEKDVSKSEKTAKEAVEKSGQQVTPVIDISGEIIVGFNEGKLKKALGLK